MIGLACYFLLQHNLFKRTMFNKFSWLHPFDNSTHPSVVFCPLLKKTLNPFFAPLKFISLNGSN